MYNVKIVVNTTVWCIGNLVSEQILRILISMRKVFTFFFLLLFFILYLYEMMEFFLRNRKEVYFSLTEDYRPKDSLSNNSEKLLRWTIIFCIVIYIIRTQNIHQMWQGCIPSSFQKTQVKYIDRETAVLTGKSQFWFFHAESVSLATFIIIITHNGQPQKILPLNLTVQLKCLCSEPCPP